MSLAILFHFLCADVMMDILISETYWAHKKWNKIASDIKLVFYSSTTSCIFISTSLHVSDNYVTIISRTYCSYATLVFFTLYGWLSGLLVGMKPVSSQPADQTATLTEWKIPVSRSYSKFSWWWAHSCPKHVVKLK